ncbi:hypothetical protein LCI18_002000 [Fusarium solani-melongenae]|uniref:Uncharacterized protein n=1 Tax=Fusarium solani subsp. cucurbitae TaxID=2747967 RepID=A0ACD3YQ60_FUSSC|nr:hypothetical protein LCI18_002000 [Fusarium solani-melongenae]
MPLIKQIAVGRRKPNMTRKEYFDHRFRIHGRIADGTEVLAHKPQYVKNKYIQTQIFDSAFGSRPDGPLNANHPWCGRDDTTELYFRDWDHVIACSTSDYVKEVVGPDGPFFADFEASIALMAYEKLVPIRTAAALQTKKGEAVDANNPTVAMLFISTSDNTRDGSELEKSITPLLTSTLESHCQNDASAVICNIGAVSDKFDLHAYFGGADMPQYALVYKVYLSDPASVPAFRKAQKHFEEAIGKLGSVDLHKSFVVFSHEALIMDMGNGTRFSLDRQPFFKELPGPSHLEG